MLAAGDDVTGAAHLALLRGLGFLAPLPPDDLAELAKTMLVRDYPPETDIVQQGTYGTSMFVVVSGALRAFTVGRDGPTRIATLDRPGVVFGEDAMLGRGERAASVRTTAPTRVLEIEKYRLDLVLRRHPEVRGLLDDVYEAHTIAAVLEGHVHLGLLSASDRAELAMGAKVQLVPRGDRVWKVGDDADRVLIVRDGVLKASRQRGADRRSILAYFNTGDVIGVSEGATSSYDLQTLGHCELVSLDRETFATVLERNKPVLERLGKDAMASSSIGSATVIDVVNKFLNEGVEVESLLVIDLDRCVRCGNCVRACHARHTFARLDRRGPIFRRRGEQHVMLPSSCRHCRDPECMVGCPTGAIQRFPHGEVDINDNCVGCENCARKCPYGNIAMRELAPSEQPNPDVKKRAIKCNLCRGYEYSNCVHECPRGAILRVDPLNYFQELAAIMHHEQVEAIHWTRAEAERRHANNKQRVLPRSTWFIPASLGLAVLAIAAVIAAAVNAPQLRGGSPIGLPLGVLAGASLLGCASQAVRKRLRNVAIGGLEAWTQFHMVFGGVALVAAFAHAGFRVTGIYTTTLLIVLALEVLLGAAGQVIYAWVPRVLTRLERDGNARLIEDLEAEDVTLARAIAELWVGLPERRAEVSRIVGSPARRWSSGYDPRRALEAGRAELDLAALPSVEKRATLAQILDKSFRLADVRAQISMHRTLRAWLVVHVAVACALVVMLAFHVATALALVM